MGLQSHMKWESWVEISPHTAEELGIHNGERVWIESPLGKVSAIARLYEGLWPNTVYLPPGMGHHTLVQWSRGSSEALLEVGANANRLKSFASEPLSGQVVSTPTRVRIYKA